ncbi:hypothetical protein LTR36_006703 [Oleoguttula mirabilis]|uniref:SGNH hydrolase-type esterase domain-containing protein n=1 Tax=Oleoguttula mirabilis TaxID=1507867 RepID=A0AAV9JBE2_9PEZI|nr:hypothetical protein LTR36_006703 [Oleoguttula mirabilis]
MLGIFTALLLTGVSHVAIARVLPEVKIDETYLNVEKRSIEGGMTLNIMPTGASITFGINSSDGDGYRKDLETLLAGNPVNYIGTQHGGTMSNNACEGYPGERIGQVDSILRNNNILSHKPNVILINVGTNDCVQNFKVSGMPQRMSAFLSYIKSEVPNSVVIVSSLLPNRKANVEQCVRTYNSALPGVVAKAKAGGQKVLFVDMHAAVPMSDISTADSTHPNDAGYMIMAHKWHAAIVSAASEISGAHG